MAGSYGFYNPQLKSIVPPWCSSRKLCARRKPRRVILKQEILSTRPQCENCEYLYDDSNENSDYSHNKDREIKKKTNVFWKTAFRLLVLFVIVAIASLLMYNEIPKADLIAKVISRDKFMTLGMEQSPTEECCRRIKYLTSKLSRTEHTLRKKIGQLKAVSLTSDVVSDYNVDNINRPHYIEGATATKGSDTEEWGGRVALWGIVPLWMTVLPLNTIFELRRPTPSDCWSFSGREGEIIIHLPNIQSVTYISVEHIQPDTAKSAPKDFNVYGILVNDTRLKLIDGHYETRGPAKQFFPVRSHTLFKNIIFHVLNNQGNPNFTCLYRVHMYGNTKTFNNPEQ